MYEYTRKQRPRARGRMSGMGWSPNFTTTMGKPACSSGGQSICATWDEQQFMSAQGCQPKSGGLIACVTSPGNVAGNQWCCPAGRPGRGAQSTVQQTAVSGADIRRLQTWINQQSGCSAGTVDGVYGPNTSRGLNCAIQATSWAAVLASFPFVSTLTTTPAGTPRPENFTFNPGATAKTPEQAGAGTPTTGGGGGGGGQQETPPPEEAGILSSLFGVLPWWGWLGIAGGVGLVAVIAVAVMSGKEEEEPRRLGRPEYKLGSIEEYAL